MLTPKINFQNYDDQSITVIGIIAIGLNEIEVMNKLVDFEVKNQIAFIIIDDGKERVLSMDALG
ncbi:MAG: hypothetical protein ACI89U_002784 [Gammaproteobacteria bacterium]|jgi:hypothetical protein